MWRSQSWAFVVPKFGTANGKEGVIIIQEVKNNTEKVQLDRGSVDDMYLLLMKVIKR